MIRLLDIINRTKSLNILEKFSKVKKVQTLLTLRKYLGPKFSGCFFSKFKKKEPDKIIRPKIYAPITYWELSLEIGRAHV